MRKRNNANDNFSKFMTDSKFLSFLFISEKLTFPNLYWIFKFPKFLKHFEI